LCKRNYADNLSTIKLFMATIHLLQNFWEYHDFKRRDCLYVTYTFYIHQPTHPIIDQSTTICHAHPCILLPSLAGILKKMLLIIGTIKTATVIPEVIISASCPPIKRLNAISG